MALNLNTQAVSDTTFIHLEDSQGNKLVDEAGQKVGITIYGKASSQYSKALATLNRKNIARKGKQQSYETNVADNVELLASITKSVHNMDLGNGPLTSFEDFKALYSNPGLFFINDQVTLALEDAGNFIQK